MQTQAHFIPSQYPSTQALTVKHFRWAPSLARLMQFKAVSMRSSWEGTMRTLAVTVILVLLILALGAQAGRKQCIEREVAPGVIACGPVLGEGL